MERIALSELLPPPPQETMLCRDLKRKKINRNLPDKSPQADRRKEYLAELHFLDIKKAPSKLSRNDPARYQKQETKKQLSRRCREEMCLGKFSTLSK